MLRIIGLLFIAAIAAIYSWSKSGFGQPTTAFDVICLALSIPLTPLAGYLAGSLLSRQTPQIRHFNGALMAVLAVWIANILNTGNGFYPDGSYDEMSSTGSMLLYFAQIVTPLLVAAVYSLFIMSLYRHYKTAAKSTLLSYMPYRLSLIVTLLLAIFAPLASDDISIESFLLIPLLFIFIGIGYFILPKSDLAASRTNRLHLAVVAFTIFVLAISATFSILGPILYMMLFMNGLDTMFLIALAPSFAIWLSYLWLMRRHA